jgi:hypothetical protein
MDRFVNRKNDQMEPVRQEKKRFDDSPDFFERSGLIILQHNIIFMPSSGQQHAGKKHFLLFLPRLDQTHELSFLIDSSTLTRRVVDLGRSYFVVVFDLQTSSADHRPSDFHVV